MAPSATNVKKTRKDGDLRMFFGASSAKTPTTSQKSGSSKQVARSSSQTTKAASSQKISPITISDPGYDDEPLQVNPIISPKKALDALDISDSDDYLPLKPTKAKSKHVGAALSRKRKTHDVESDDDDIMPLLKKQAVASNPTIPTPEASTSKSKKIEKDEDFDMASEAFEFHSKDEFLSSGDDYRPKKALEMERLPPPKKPSAPEKAAEKETTRQPTKTQIWASIQAAKLAKPQPARGTKEIPNGDPNALAGLAFVFTGELVSLARDEALDIATRFGGLCRAWRRCWAQEVGSHQKHKLKTLDEDAFLKLISTRKVKESDLEEKTKKKMEKESPDNHKAEEKMEKREKAESKPSAAVKIIDPKDSTSLKDVCGNKTAVEKLHQWLEDWQGSMKAGFKNPGKNMMNIYRAVLITGPPGIGKTTSAHLCAKMAGYTPIELNASDARNKKLVNGLNINNSSLDGYIKGNKETNSMGVPITDRTCLIMDEVDGMSAGDRGGVGALNALIKRCKVTPSFVQVPIICIANDRNAQKLNPLKGTTFNLSFQRPQVQSIRSRIMTIVFKENLKIPANVVDQLITGAQSDIRQVLNMLSTWKLSNSTMSFDESKDIVKMNEKYQIMSPFDIS
ncbi:P-loop containing nucleoside triphosphate hydrolase protein, partial [Ephemerocybe angulata]